MNILHRIVFTLLVLSATTIAHAEWMPSPTGHLANDYSGILTQFQLNSLEQRLEAFSDSTSNQILIIITPTIGNEDENAVAQRIGQAWGVGQKEFDNGLVLLIKSKTTDENWGAVAIATGYGVEGILPDIYCRHIIEEQILPHLSNADYYMAITTALDVIMPAMQGEYNYDQYKADHNISDSGGILFTTIFIIIVVIIIIRYLRHHPNDFDSGSGGGGIFFGNLPGGYWSSSGGYTNGGFGGFGGGSFGGGGASGRF